MFKYITNKKAILSGKKEINFIDKKIDTEEHGFVVEIQAIGVCTSDCFNYLYNNTGYFGHEMVGKVLTPYQNFKKGDLVLLLHRYGCDNCNQCKLGFSHLCEKPIKTPIGFSKYVVIDENAIKKSVFKLPNDSKIEEMAFLDSVSCALHCIERLSLKEKEKDILILGNGFMAIIFYLILKKMNKRVTIVGSDEQKNNLIRSKNVIEEHNILSSLKFDVGIITGTNEQFLAKYINKLKPNSKLMFFNKYREYNFLDFEYIRNNEINIYFSKHTTRECIERAIVLLHKNKINLSQFINQFNSLDDLEKVINKTLNKEIIRGVLIAK
ncbi:Alcohol dehydrogenase GroES domain protein [Bacillus cereus ATCC 10876]|uniref:alcohol dehydrogenase catalytic domain-containing protein n=1 Tax=Bacillus TaxID=1386 RepID=UPI00019FFADA|nr:MULTISPECIES: zinc-binding dehydrogenase [Bacillus]MDJ0281869.1 zinc-binding dehydrogenase [Bacillus bombysepticus]EEK48415.1 Alcohol dehydrogenase GroES domain protein [Bacillus cereus ATCC 10876]KFL63428.1 alcohol dehydrogenase GroES-like domain protein [Bacillus cereus ATCC 10876]MBO1129457.1 zinc-binding dehydrogenase [Bacillus cereus]MDJ0295856.1 zinc-binding dehydrogenase [Bacillus bombysepticus]